MNDPLTEAQVRLVDLMVGGCTCHTKTPEVSHHATRCHFRLAAEVGDLIQLALDRQALSIEASACVCDRVRAEALATAQSTFLTETGRSAHRSFAAGAESCAISIRSELSR